MAPQRYLAITLGMVIVSTFGIALANRHIDPLMLRDPGSEPVGVGAERRQPGNDFWHKALAVAALKPAGLILGTSRAATGLDIAHPRFNAAAQPVYNLSLAGASIEQICQLLVHAQRTRALQQVVIGLDLESFLQSGRIDFDPAVLAGNKESQPQWMTRLRLDLSWRALAASVALLRSTDEETAPSGAARSRARAEDLEGQQGMFWVTEFNNFYARRPLLFPHRDRVSQWNSDSRRAASLRAFREILSFARSEGIDVRFFVSPVHARYLEWYRRVGWWGLFEKWKTALVEAVAEEARGNPGRKPFPLWDFSGYNDVTMEAVPRLGDLHARMRWYYESSHYSREHGNVVLDRVLDVRRAVDTGSGEFGVLIDAGNIDSHLIRTALDAQTYHSAFPAEVENIGAIVALLRRVTRR